MGHELPCLPGNLQGSHLLRLRSQLVRTSNSSSKISLSGAYHGSNCVFLAETHMIKKPYCHSGRGNACTCTYLWPSERMRNVCFRLSVFWPGPVNSMSPILMVTSPPLPGDKETHISEYQQRIALSPMEKVLNFRMLLVRRNPAHADVFVSASGDCSVKVCASCIPCYRHPCGGNS